MRKKALQKNKAFVILYAIIVASIVLSVAFGVSNIALKEVNFSTSAQNTNDAFYAADTGIECATFNDRTSSLSFRPVGGSDQVVCAGNTIPMTGSYAAGWAFDLPLSNGACAKVTVFKDTITSSPKIITKIVSRGYNVGAAGSLCSLMNYQTEREIRVTY